jgi:hypothetical protein
MKQLRLLTLGIAVLLLVSQLDGRTSIAVGQTSTVQQTFPSSKQGPPAILTGASARKVGFRLTDWKTIHSHSSEDAQQQIATLMKIGCEVKSENHGNHIDVRYRCVNWKALKLTSDQLVNQWTTWCQAKGMETVVVDPVASTKKPTVRFRLAVPQTVHLHDNEEASQVIATLKLIGCQVTSNDHGNHIDATFSCPSWKTIELSSDEKAHSWQTWLNESGFETEHTH